MAFLRTAGIVGLLFAMAAAGQETLDRSTPDSSQNRAQTQGPRPAGPPLRVAVDMVLVNATVTDPANRFVRGLSQQQFRVWEDKIEQPIEYFSAENVPVSVGIVFDISGSMENKLKQARAAASTFLRMSDRDDEYFLIQ